MYLHRKMLHLPVALNPKELVGNISIAVLMASFPYTPRFSYVGHPHVPPQEDVGLPSGHEPKGVGGDMSIVALNPKELVGDMSKLSLLVKIYGRKCHPSLRDSGKKNLP